MLHANIMRITFSFVMELIESKTILILYIYDVITRIANCYIFYCNLCLQSNAMLPTTECSRGDVPTNSL